MSNYRSIAGIIADQLTKYTGSNLRKLCRRGKIPARREGNVWMIDVAALMRYEQQSAELGKQRHNPHRNPQDPK